MTSTKIVILTGAGISAESGIQTFRDAGGLWEGHAVEQVATPEGFAADPVLREFSGEVTLVTQNVDDLHERGGSTDVIHMHGELLSAFCTACNHRWRQSEDLTPETPCPACQTQGGPRPDIVWFGEMPYQMRRLEAAVSDCSLFVSIGTSGAVYPAAGFVHMAKTYGARTLELNLEPSQGSAAFDEARHGPATQLVPEWVDSMLT